MWVEENGADRAEVGVRFFNVFLVYCFPLKKFEVKFTYKISHLKVYNSMAFSTFTVLCNHHLYQVPKHSITPKKNLVPIKKSPPFLLCQDPGNHQSATISMDLLILDILCKCNHTIFVCVCVSSFFHLA